ncbi:MAG: hypothetical protein ABIR96_06740, partial [Bdellovibrionota bacterium]
MKKIYQSSVHKRLTKKRARRSVTNSKRFKLKKAERRLDKLLLDTPLEICAPSMFSIIENYAKTVGFFDRFVREAAKGRLVKLDLSKVDKITPDTVLYLLSRIDFLFSKFPKVRIQGNGPRNRECHELLHRSGYYRFVNVQKAGAYQHEHVLEILTAKKVETRKAEAVREFTSKHLSDGNSKILYGKEIYTTLIECMANTKNHAFGNDIVTRGGTWWLIAVYKPLESCVSFAFLDDGAGIPATVQKTLKESFVDLFQNVIAKLGLTSDERFITSALKG